MSPDYLWFFVPHPVVTCLFFAYLFKCVDSKSNGMLGTIRRFLHQQLYNIQNIFLAICGERFVNLFKRLYAYIFEQANPFV